MTSAEKPIDSARRAVSGQRDGIDDGLEAGQEPERSQGLSTRSMVSGAARRGFHGSGGTVVL
jgi:hypothetical protein